MSPMIEDWLQLAFPHVPLILWASNCELLA